MADSAITWLNKPANSFTDPFVQQYSPSSVSKLQDIFSPILSAAKGNIDLQRAEALKRLAASQAARGTLRSGISAYPRTALEQTGLASLGDISGNIANQIGQTEMQRSLIGSQANAANQNAYNDYLRQMDLAKIIGEMNKPSTLDNIFAGFSSIGMPLATMYATKGAVR